MTEQPNPQDPQREPEQDQPQEQPEPGRHREQDQPEQPPQPTGDHALRRPDGVWEVHLTTGEDRTASLRGLTHAVAIALVREGNGGETCVDQIGYTIGGWAGEAVSASAY
jgi:hypothetical protein